MCADSKRKNKDYSKVFCCNNRKNVPSTEIGKAEIEAGFRRKSRSWSKLPLSLVLLQV